MLELVVVVVYLLTLALFCVEKRQEMVLKNYDFSNKFINIICEIAWPVDQYILLSSLFMV